VNGIVEEEQDEDAAFVAAELCHFQLSKVKNGSVVANGVVVNWGCCKWSNCDWGCYKWSSCEWGCCKWSSCEWHSCNWVIANGVVANGMVANGGEDGNNYGGFFFFATFFVGFASPKDCFLVPSPDFFFLHSHEDHQ
jgi:hypothetical protein